MRPAHRPSQRGFTLIELMIVVAIIGVLSAVAIPQLMNYMRKAKTSEALQQLEKLRNSARAYYQDQRTDADSLEMLAMQFPATVATTPALNCCEDGSDPCDPDADNWDHPTWDALTFQMDEAHYFRYEFVSQGEGSDAEFTARAYGDLDCDGDLSTFAVYGEGRAGGEVTTSTSASRVRPLE